MFDPANLLDGPSAAIVVGGTLLATWLRCGSGDCARAARAVAGLSRARFNAARARAELATQIQDIQRDGLLRAAPHHYEDSELEDATEALIATRSIPALMQAHQAHHRRRAGANERAVRTLAQASELAPVFGLAGTLISLSQLPAAGIARGALTDAIGMAVLTTLYGLLLANLVLAPLARKVERASLREEAERQRVIDWLAQQVAEAAPHVPQGTRVPQGPRMRGSAAA
ncbi:MAG: MotA/TolQ/ExbB proton channel family protein [Novosphingobium sp.]|nr:MotA/TolQ/ExbB proton channel family protein [Novosphingobium sp.]